MIKPRIQLVGGCAASVQNEMFPSRMSEDVSTNEASVSGVVSGLLNEFLATIIVAVNASAAVVRVLSPDGLALRTIGCAGLPAGAFDTECIVDDDCSVCGKSASEKTQELAAAEVCKERFGKDAFGAACNFVLAIPLDKEDQQSDPDVALTLYFANEQDVSDAVRQSLKSYAELTRIALKNAWQHEDAHQVGLLAERQAIANEIHDSLAQTLYFAKIRSSLLMDAMKTDNDLLAYKCAQDIDEALDSGQKTVRELVTHFRCQMDPKGLTFALQKLVKDFNARSGIALEYHNELEELALPLEHELQVFLIVRESLVNIASHSGATIARLDVMQENNHYQFVIEDNGGGVGDGASSEGHYGLEIMRERALRIGGVVEVENLQGLGTRVQLVIGVPEA